VVERCGARDYPFAGTGDFEQQEIELCSPNLSIVEDRDKGAKINFVTGGCYGARANERTNNG
jgi:hypothetical protein